MMMNYEISSKMVAQQGKMIKGMKVGFAPSFTVPDVMAPHREMIESLKVGLAASSYTVPDIMAPHREMMESLKIGLAASSYTVPDIMAPHREMMESLKIGLAASSYTVPDIMAPHREMMGSLKIGLAASSYIVPDIMAPHREIMKNFRLSLTPLFAVPDIVAPHRKMFEDMKIGLDATFKIANAVERQEDYLKGITTALRHSNLYESGNISNLDISKAIDSVKKNAGVEFQEFLDDMSFQDRKLNPPKKAGKENRDITNQSVRNVLSNEYVTIVARLLVFVVAVGETVDYDLRIIILTGLANYFFPFSFWDDKNKSE